MSNSQKGFSFFKPKSKFSIESKSNVVVKSGSEIISEPERKILDCYYFAYGSNTNLEQMSARLSKLPRGSYAVVGAAKLYNYNLTFRANRPTAIVGVADIDYTHGGVVWGVLYRCTSAVLDALDVFEGAPSVYYRHTAPVYTENGRRYHTTLYLMANKSRCELLPSITYLRRILGGFTHFRLDISSLLRGLDRVERHSRLYVQASSDVGRFASLNHISRRVQ